ncbi:hypothetical protein J6590_065470 [Homalodisca vitripennis]|nr:hypothetical protein J6590_065470 [Homalodisca vitripennis]
MNYDKKGIERKADSDIICSPNVITCSQTELSSHPGAYGRFGNPVIETISLCQWCTVALDCGRSPVIRGCGILPREVVKSTDQSMGNAVFGMVDEGDVWNAVWSCWPGKLHYCHYLLFNPKRIQPEVVQSPRRASSVYVALLKFVSLLDPIGSCTVAKTCELCICCTTEVRIAARPNRKSYSRQDVRALYMLHY